MNWKSFKKELHNDDEYRNFLSRRDLSFDISEMVIEARTIKGLTQEELAEKSGTKQPGIARVENESTLPSLGFLSKLASAMDTYLIPPKFAFMENYKSIDLNLVFEEKELGFSEDDCLSSIVVSAESSSWEPMRGSLNNETYNHAY